jgi:hypothetical protein
MATLRIDLEVKDYDMWRTAFGKDAGGRGRHGARRHRIFQAPGNERSVSLDIDFSTVAEAERFLAVLRDEVWPSRDKARRRSVRRRHGSSTWSKRRSTADRWPSGAACGDRMNGSGPEPRGF